MARSERPDILNNLPWRVELNGIQVVPDRDRTGRVADLFWIWFAANIGILGVVYGAIVVSFGMDFWQGILIAVIGSASFLLVGYFTVAGREGGAPMMTLSRAVFGLYGNVLPTVVSWVSLVGWETISVITGTFALISLFSMAVPASGWLVAGMAMAAMAGTTIAAGLLGQATLVVIQTWASYLFGILTLGILALLVPGAHWSVLWHHPAGPWISGFLPALSIVVAGTGLSWANAAADYGRYLPRAARSGRIVWAVAAGAALPLVVLISAGMLLATRSPGLATAGNPVAVIQAALPAWASVPYLVVAAGGLIVEADLGLYSSGLNLLSLFVPLERYKTVVVDAVIMAVGTVYVLFVARNFFGPFEAFILLMGIGIAAWAGIFFSDQAWRWRSRPEPYPKPLLFDPKACGGHVRLGVSWPAVLSWLFGCGAGILFTGSAFFRGPLASGIFAASSLELAVAFGVSAVLYLGLTHGAAAGRRSGR